MENTLIQKIKKPSASQDSGIVFFTYVLLLNIPLFSLILYRYIMNVDLTWVAWIYVVCVFVGYYFFISLCIILPSYLLIYFRKAAEIMAFSLLSILVYFLVLDSII